ncbi:DUF2829 domain-containing protein [Agarilytica rhodophyticola]|uniref:DUF2829 domain-containing protein n=1 Tax=Agarilytica rhodophyticola TaxID=1737490 RepID=UPI001C1FD42C|nr:DUF2829 domain-containing protein [Agarilytica rhodophyticola]
MPEFKVCMYPFGPLVGPFLFLELENMPHNMNFGDALQAIKDGREVARAGWNGKNQFVFMIKASDYQKTLGFDLKVCDGLAIKTSKNEIQVGWLASQQDMLADDWKIIE